MIKGIIFDMDGVVIDSLEHFYKSYHQLMWEEFAIDVTKEEFAKVLGSKAEDAIKTILKEYDLKGDGTELKKKWDELADVEKGDISLKKGIKEKLPKLKKEYDIAIATGNNKKFAHHILENLKIRKYFTTIVTADHVHEAKPNPEIFLKAAEELSLKPNECVVIEDALLGIQAAKNANMYVISIKDEFTQHQDHNIADLQLNSVSELNSKTITKLGE